MRKITVVLVLCIVALAAGSGVLAGKNKSTQAIAELKPTDGGRIVAKIQFLDSGDPSSGLFVAGNASGLDPNETYVSLIYSAGSVSTGAFACQPTNGILDNNQMFVGFWKVDVTGEGKLSTLKAGDSFALLEDVGTVSIRRVDGTDRVLEACGDVIELDNKTIRRGRR